MSGNNENTAVNEEVKNLYMEYVNPSLMRLVAFMGYDKVEDHSLGSQVWDIFGDEYTDCLGGFGVFSAGHSHPKIKEAVRKQLDKMPLASRVLLNEPYARLAEKLAHITPGNLKYTFMCNSGTEAIEGALKISRLKTHKHGIIYTERAYHGKTMGSLSVTDRETFQKPFRPLLPGTKRVPFGNTDALAKAINDDIACFVVEPVQGEGGINLPPDDYLPAVMEICRKNNVILIADEVQTGLGRTGKMFACEHWGIEPDIMTLAKALGGGIIPVGAIIVTPEVWEVFEDNPLIHSSTFGGNPLACTAALATLEVIEEEGLIEKAAANGKILLDGLKSIKNDFPGMVKDVRGMGCLIGMEFADSDTGGLIISSLAARRILVAFTLNQQNVIRIEPPLGITEMDISHILEMFRESASEVSSLIESLK